MIIEEVYEFEGFDMRWCFTKGHVPPEEFLKQLSSSHKTIYTADDFKVVHSYARYIPVGPDMPGKTLIYFHYEKGRGAFPVTYIEL
jgi:hypothetical protein